MNRRFAQIDTDFDLDGQGYLSRDNTASLDRRASSSMWQQWAWMAWKWSWQWRMPLASPTDTEAEAVTTPGKLIDLIVSKISGHFSNKCHSMVIFHQLRKLRLAIGS